MILSWLRWRCTRSRIDREAARLFNAHGQSAFLRAHEKAWSAMGEGRRAEARFWREVCREIGRQLRRQALIRSLFQKPTPAVTQPPRLPRAQPWPPPPVPDWVMTRPLTLVERAGDSSAAKALRDFT